MHVGFVHPRCPSDLCAEAKTEAAGFIFRRDLGDQAQTCSWGGHGGTCTTLDKLSAIVALLRAFSGRPRRR